jgi:type IV pilus assembly protein PilV
MQGSNAKKIMVRNSKQSGFSLLEALISILILSVGALGVAGLQTVSLKNAKSADQRGRAAVFAQMMMDEASLRIAETKQESPNIVGTLANVPCASNPTTPLTVWRQRLDCAIPGALGAVSYDNSTNRLIVTVRFDDSLGLGGSATQDISIDTRL